MTFFELEMEVRSSFAYGKNLSVYGKCLIIEILRVAVPQLEIKPTETYDELMDRLGLKSSKELSIRIMNTYGLTKLTFSLFQTYGKIRPLESPNDWFDTFRLNGICSSFDMVMWHKFDRPCSENDILYTVNYDPKPIDESVKLDFDRVQKLLVNELRTFIIENQMYQSIENSKSSSDKTLIDEKQSVGKTDKNTDFSTDWLEGGKRIYRPNPIKKLSAKEICDLCYLHYPYYFAGAHGCDVFDYSEKSLSLEEITLFLKRYPSALVGYVMNTDTYSSGNGGQHWTSLTLSQGCASLICSFGSSFNEFADDGKMYNTLSRLGYAFRYNTQRIQQDHHSCGMFSTLSCYLMLCTNCNIPNTIKLLGVGGEDLVKGKSIQDFVNALAFRNSDLQ